MIVSVQEARKRFSRLIELVEQGEEVVIARRGKQVARLVRTGAGGQRIGAPRLGTMKGEISWVEGWDRPFTDGEAEAFWDGRD